MSIEILRNSDDHCTFVAIAWYVLCTGQTEIITQNGTKRSVRAQLGKEGQKYMNQKTQNKDRV